MKLEIFQITVIFGGSQVPREVQAKSSSQKNHPGSSLQKSPLGCSPKRSPRTFRRKLPSVQTFAGRSLKNTPEKFPRYFPGNPVDTVPIKKGSLKKPLHCSLKYSPKNIGAQKESQQKHPKPSTNSSPRNLSWLRPSETPRIVSSIEPSGDRIGRVEPGSMDLVQGLLRISSLADCMS